MPYSIRHLSLVSLQKKKYFLDANIWIKILKPPFNISAKDQKYITFVESFKGHILNPKIVIPSLLLSEIINRYLRDVSFPIFCNKTGIKREPANFKQFYRTTPQYLSDYVSLCEDIKAYQNYFELIPDELTTTIKQKHILTNLPANIDFNDHYYYLLAKNNKFTIVTDDGDYFVEDVDIITQNNDLVSRAKALVKPTSK